MLLRPWRKEDFRPYHAIVSHPDVHRHFGPEPMSAEECWRRLTSAAGHWEFCSFGSWAVERKPDGALLGFAGLFNAWRDLDPDFGDLRRFGVRRWSFSKYQHCFAHLLGTFL